MCRAGDGGGLEFRARLSMEPGGWSPSESELPDREPGLEMSQKKKKHTRKTEPAKVSFMQLIPKGQSGFSEQVSPTLGTFSTSQAPTGPGKDTGASRGCLLWQMTSPRGPTSCLSRTPQSSPPGSTEGDPLAGRRLGGREEAKGNAERGAGSSLQDAWPATLGSDTSSDLPCRKEVVPAPGRRPSQHLLLPGPQPGHQVRCCRAFGGKSSQVLGWRGRVSVPGGPGWPAAVMLHSSESSSAGRGGGGTEAETEN